MSLFTIHKLVSTVDDFLPILEVQGRRVDNDSDDEDEDDESDQERPQDNDGTTPEAQDIISLLNSKESHQASLAQFQAMVTSCKYPGSVVMQEKESLIRMIFGYEQVSSDDIVCTQFLIFHFV